MGRVQQRERKNLTCGEGSGIFVYISENSTNIKVSILQYHSESNEHKNLSWDTHWDKYFLEKCVAQANRACDEVVMSLFKVVYFQEKKYIHSYKFASLYEFFVSCKTPITKKLYYHGKIYVDMMFAIYTIF